MLMLMFSALILTFVLNIIYFNALREFVGHWRISDAAISKYGSAPNLNMMAWGATRSFQVVKVILDISIKGTRDIDIARSARWCALLMTLSFISFGIFLIAFFMSKQSAVGMINPSI